MAAEIPNDPLALYREGIRERVESLDASGLADLAHAPERVLDEMAERLCAILAVLNSEVVGDGWEDDIDTLTSMAARWELLADAVRSVKRRRENE